jgi:tetratricopeptide (TPR) repeat protein
MKRMRKIEMLLLLSFVCNLTFAQQISIKDQAIEQFKKENYSQAIGLMEKALVDNPNDAEIYYYLGFFNHYNAYDSRPLIGYDSSNSQKILNYLDKALVINPNYGDAKYLYLTECSAAAFKEYQNNNLSKVKFYFDKAFKKGAIPEWAIELGENILNSCEQDAILFTGGDFSLNICLFAQLHDNFRKDITIVPLALLDRPSFILALTNNENSKIIRGLKTGLTREQIMDMHPYKWDTLTISLNVPSSLLSKYSLSNGFKMDWVIEPDLTSNRIVSKIEGEDSRKRTYLSPTRAMLLNIIETNKWQRPIFFTNTFDLYFLAGLEKYFQNCGLVSRLTPLKTDNSKFKIDTTSLEKIVFNTKLEKLKTIINNDQPRASGIIGLYGYSYYLLANYFSSNGQKDKIPEIINKYKQNIMIGFDPDYENEYLNSIEKMKN